MLHYNQDSESCALKTQSFLVDYEHSATSLGHMYANDTVTGIHVESQSQNVEIYIICQTSATTSDKTDCGSSVGIVKSLSHGLLPSIV